MTQPTAKPELSKPPSPWYQWQFRYEPGLVAAVVMLFVPDSRTQTPRMYSAISGWHSADREEEAFAEAFRSAKEDAQASEATLPAWAR